MTTESTCSINGAITMHRMNFSVHIVNVTTYRLAQKWHIFLTSNIFQFQTFFTVENHNKISNNTITKDPKFPTHLKCAPALPSEMSMS